MMTSSPLDPQIRRGRHGTRVHPRRTPNGPRRSPHRRYEIDDRTYFFFFVVVVVVVAGSLAESSLGSLDRRFTPTSTNYCSGIRRGEPRASLRYAALAFLTNQAHKAQLAARSTKLNRLLVKGAPIGAIYYRFHVESDYRERKIDISTLNRTYGATYETLIKLLFYPHAK